MLPHFVKLLHRIWTVWLSQMSSSTPAQVFAACVFVLTQIFKSLRNLRDGGRFSFDKLKQFWRDHWKGNIRDGLLAILVVGALDGAWLTVKVIYDDHQALAAKASIPPPKCAVCPTCSTCPTPALTTRTVSVPAPVEEPHNCWMTNHFEFPGPYSLRDRE